MRPIVQVRNLSKRYHLRWSRNKHPTLREALVGAVKSPFERLAGRNGSESALWALRNVSFEVQPGEVIGIIGPNGAGKSTLLKILSRITKPTEGEADIYGRVGSLLEIGTGFHPDLTGRENIYLNAAILGMRRAEIRRKLDEIIAFSEVDQFLEVPVKFYSSGMYVRLAFAVAAHLEPEVLILDEVLAVGDAKFQKKCLKKMYEVSREGRAVFFVSHNMESIKQLCNRVFLINAGQLSEGANMLATIAQYTDDSSLKHTQTESADSEVSVLAASAPVGPG
jgi:lipopolysaccharide transport system ATP-binding protein